MPAQKPTTSKPLHERTVLVGAGLTLTQKAALDVLVTAEGRTTSNTIAILVVGGLSRLKRGATMQQLVKEARDAGLISNR